MPDERRKCEACGKYLAVKGSTRCRWHAGKRAAPRETVTVHVGGRVVDQASLRRMVEAEMLRIRRRPPGLA